MTSKHIQAPGAVVMIRPHRFHSNPETASDNAFQRTSGDLSGKQIAKAAIEESARLVEVSVPTIELAGGSIRCMLAGIHLARRY